VSVRVGTSGWVYPHWRGLFYPPRLRQADWFAYFAREFDTVEINNSFYRLPSEAAFDAWCAQAPAGFCYAVKASRYLTHMKKLKDPEDPLRRFFERADRLGERLGPVLYQLPPHWHADLGRFEYFLQVLPPHHTHVVEFRDASWFRDDIFALLERYGVAHCIHDMPPLEVPARVTARQVYVRFHGARHDGGNYSHAELGAWAERIHQWLSEGRQVWAYFNNDGGGFALSNARTLKSLLSGGSGELF
jgi:uncharacterized protein YecE (DUF72 family)